MTGIGIRPFAANALRDLHRGEMGDGPWVEAGLDEPKVAATAARAPQSARARVMGRSAFRDWMRGVALRGFGVSRVRPWYTLPTPSAFTEMSRWVSSEKQASFHGG